MKYIKKHKLITAIIVTAFISVSILLLTFFYGANSRIGIVTKLYNTIEGPMINAGNSVKGLFSGVFRYKDLLEENEALKEENAKLRDEISRAALSEGELEELRDLAKILNYDFIKGETDIVTAKVVSLDGINWTSTFTIDKGEESGIKKDAIVLSGDGLVGRIAETGDGWSKVIPIIDEDSHISFMIEGSNQIGIIEGASDGTLRGYMLDSNAVVPEGARLVTSGIGKYPAGVLIGIVTSSGYNPNNLLLEITAVPTCDFGGLVKVSVII